MTAPLLDATTLAEFRALQESSMPNQCDLITFASALTTTHGTTLTPIIVATVPCRIGRTLGLILVNAEQLTPEASFTVYLPANTDTTGVTRLIVRGTTDGVAWSVQLVVTGTDEPRSFSAVRKLQAKLAIDTVTPPPAVASVVITEA